MTNLSEKKGGGLIYNPPMMEFDGSTGYYNTGIGFSGMSGNKMTVLLRFSIAEFTGDKLVRVLRLEDSNNYSRLSLIAYSSDYSDADRANSIQFYVASATNVGVCLLQSPTGYLDGQTHTLFAAYDGDTGSATFIIDGQDADDTGNADRVAPTTATLGLSDELGLGANPSGANSIAGKIGFFGLHNVYLTNWSDFMDQYGNPKPTDFSGWLLGHFAGKMDESVGTAGVMTKNGTITLVDPGQAPHIGLPTKGTAIATDIQKNRVAWVDGVELVGDLANSLLLYHQFDGTDGTNIGGTKPMLCYDDTTFFSLVGAPLLNGSGYLVAAANNNIITIDPDIRWPSRSGKTRIYEFWGRYAAAPTTSADYIPQVRINYVDDSNYWTARIGHGSNLVYNEQYEWISGALGEINSSVSASISGAFRWCLRIEDQGDQVFSMCTIQRESTEASDLDITQSPAIQLHKVSRPNQSEALFNFRWESVSNYANCQLRGMMVYDR